MVGSRLDRDCGSIPTFFASRWANRFTFEERPVPQLTESGQILVGGQMTRYLIRHLPVSSFPALPAAIQGQLDLRGCLIPQTYEARRPENVVRASLERTGSSDWAVLCSAKGTVSLLVFFGGDPGHPFTLASAPETERLQSHDRERRSRIQLGH